jgi:hypothetical protein
VVVFTASQEAYAGRLLDMLDTDRHVRYRLYRDSCVFVEGNFVKDLDMLGRDLQRVSSLPGSDLCDSLRPSCLPLVVFNNSVMMSSLFSLSDNHCGQFAAGLCLSPRQWHSD